MLYIFSRSQIIAKLILMILMTAFLLPTTSQSFAAEKTYIPSRKFLEIDPYRKSKARVELSGIENDQELEVVKDAINDVLRFIRLFGLGNKLPDGSIVMKNTREHPAFQILSTAQGREQLNIDPASRRHDERTFNWNIKSNNQLSVDVILKHTPLSDGPAESPNERIYRFTFVKGLCDANWCLNEAQQLK